MIKRYYQSVGGETNNYTIVYTNNDQTVNILVQIYSTTIYNGLYTSDPIVGYSPDLPAVNSVVALTVTGKTIISATLNGVPGSITGSGASWSNVNGDLLLNFQTN